MHVASGWNASCGIDGPLARELLEELYAGQAVARLRPNGRPVLWATSLEVLAVFSGSQVLR